MPTRPTWSGSLQISLVSIAVKIFPASNTGNQVEFHQIDKKTHQRVHQRDQRIGAFSDPLLCAGWALGQFPLEAEQVFEKVVAPLGWCCGPGAFKSTRNRMDAMTIAE